VYNFFNLLPGTPVVYQGDEIAMRDLFIPYSICKDPMCLKNPDMFATTGRDPERTPMQWTSGPQAGFSSNASTWLPVNPDHTTVNVETESKDPTSPLEIMKATLAFRKSQSNLALGRITQVPDISGDLFDDLIVVKYLMGASVSATVANWNT
ncbi:MAL1, partial [Symbiodinium sp. CCMP2456]